jgi:DNA-directed RNA polymerase specialized sigma24 family protein
MRAFLEHVALQAASAEESDGIWRMFVGDVWFRDELARQARRALKAKRQPWTWQEDVVNEALLRFREQLRKQPDLRVDRQRVETTFPGWIGARLRFACNDAVDFLHRLHGRHLPATLEPADHHAPPPVDVWIDMRMAIDALEEPIRSVMLLHEIKRPLHEIAEAVGCSFWETRRLLQSGIEQLARRLRDYRLDKQRGEGPISSSSTTT